jgi:cell fate regulator YaaT (PSP1 superfamily)
LSGGGPRYARFIQQTIIGVRFTQVGKIYHFDSSAFTDLTVGEHVIVDTSRGKHLGEVVQVMDDRPSSPDGSWKPVERRATPRDLLLRETWRSKQTEAMIECRARAAELRLNGVKIVAAEFNYDGSRLTFLYQHRKRRKGRSQELEKRHEQEVRQIPGGNAPDRPA